MNEIIHSISGYILSFFSNNLRYPKNVFCDIIIETAKKGNLEENLLKNYATYCDPRLNYSQSLEMAFLLSTMI